MHPYLAELLSEAHVGELRPVRLSGPGHLFESARCR